MPLTPVVYYPGDSYAYVVWVKYISKFPIGWDGHTCAFCHGDPCAEFPKIRIPGLIGTYRKRRGKRFETCPMCLGRPS